MGGAFTDLHKNNKELWLLLCAAPPYRLIPELTALSFPLGIAVLLFSRKKEQEMERKKQWESGPLTLGPIPSSKPVLCVHLWLVMKSQKLEEKKV